MQELGGSSPLTRGKPASLLCRSMAVGLIPAHAGKTTLTWVVSVKVRAHPRSRGENDTEAQQAATLAGSSPLTRGKRGDPVEIGIGGGLIPAHAGKTIRFLRRACTPGAHPRSRGENNRRPDPAPRNPGSSPLTRGKRSMTWGGDTASGLIPAHAGKTVSC